MGSLINAAWAVEASDVAKFTNQLVGGKPLYTFPYALPSDLAQPGSQVFDLAGDINYKDPYVQQWNVTVERDPRLPDRLASPTMAGHGTESWRRLPTWTRWRRTPVGFAKAARSPRRTRCWQCRSSYLTNAARSNYNALTVSVNKRMSKGLQYQVSYNHAKNLSNGGGYAPSGFASEGGGTLTDPSNPNLDYGNVALHAATTGCWPTFLYNLPFKMRNKVGNQLISGWEVAGVVLFQTGPFLTVLASGADPSGTNFPNLQGSGRADMAPGKVSISPPPKARRSLSGSMPLHSRCRLPNNIGRFLATNRLASRSAPARRRFPFRLFRSIAIYRTHASLRLRISAANPRIESSELWYAGADVE